MPTDLALGNNTPAGALELRAMQPMPDGSGYAALLVIRSGSFAAALPYLMMRDTVRGFADALGALVAGADGEATLASRSGEDRVLIVRDADVVQVRGELSDDDEEQRLRFRFTTPAAGLRALHDGLRLLLGA